MSGVVGFGSNELTLKTLSRSVCVSVPPLTSPPLRPVLQDLTLGVRNISRFFGFQLTEEQVQRISEASTFRAMREKSNDSHAGMGKVFFRKGNTFKHPFPNCNAPRLGDLSEVSMRPFQL